MAQFFNWLRFGGTGNFALDFALALIISAVMAWLVSIRISAPIGVLNYEHYTYPAWSSSSDSDHGDVLYPGGPGLVPGLGGFALYYPLPHLIKDIPI